MLSWLFDPFIMNWSSLSLVIFFALKSILSHINNVTSVFVFVFKLVMDAFKMIPLPCPCLMPSLWVWVDLIVVNRIQKKWWDVIPIFLFIWFWIVPLLCVQVYSSFFSPARSNLVLILSSVFFISDVLVFISRSWVEIFLFILHVST